jgi:hypothetical protein
MAKLLELIAVSLLCVLTSTGCHSRSKSSEVIGTLELPLITQPLTSKNILDGFLAIKTSPPDSRHLNEMNRKSLLLFVTQLCAVVATAQEDDVLFPIDSEAWNIMTTNFPSLVEAQNDSSVAERGRISMKKLWPWLLRTDSRTGQGV